MTSGNSDHNSSPTGDRAGTDLPLHWVEEAYSDRDVAAVVIDERGIAIFANDPARDLLALDGHDEIAGIELSDGSRFGDLIDRMRTDGLALHAWNGNFAFNGSSSVQIELIRLPTPSQLILCQIQPDSKLDNRARAQLIGELTEYPPHENDLERAGRAVVDILYRYLQAPILASYCEHGELSTTWSAGDEQRCAQLGQSVPSFVESAENSLKCLLDEQANSVVLPFKIAADSTVVLSIGLDAEDRTISPSSPFWICLASAAKTSLQSTRLAQLNRQERLRLRAVIEHMPVALMLFDVEGRVLDLNLRARAMAGRREWKRIGDEYYPFEVCDVDGNPLPKEEWPLMRAVERGICCEEEEFVIDFGEQQRTVSMTVLPITDDHDRVTSYLATGRDVTQRSEEDKRKDEFLSVASHELRSPLTPLVGFLQLSRQQAESGKLVDADVLKRAEYQVHRLQRLIDGLLDHTRLETGKLPVHRKLVEMKQLVRRIMHPWCEGARGDRVKLSLPDETIDAYVDPDRIDQVLTNVVDNAFRHGRADGDVEVRLRARDDQILIIVRDEGDGIPREIVDRVFERYFHSPGAEASSTGLGLYISRQIVEDHEGTIDIDSASGHPTTVTICLPRDPTSPAS